LLDDVAAAAAAGVDLDAVGLDPGSDGGVVDVERQGLVELLRVLEPVRSTRPSCASLEGAQAVMAKSAAAGRGAWTART
jgi:hypothetical protein